MEPIIEIISRNIISNYEYKPKLKNEYITMINRINNTKINIIQSYRSNNYILLYNILHEEILYLSQQQIYFNKYLKYDIGLILDEYLDDNIKQYNHYIINLLSE